MNREQRKGWTEQSGMIALSTVISGGGSAPVKRSAIPYRLGGAVAILHLGAFLSSTLLVNVNRPFPLDQTRPDFVQGHQGTG